MNKTFHIGNLTRDPETSFSKEGKAITRFSLAVNGRGDKVNYFDFTAFDKTAENIGKFKKKGEPLLVEGRLETDSWEKDGKKQYKTYIVAQDVQFLNSGKGQSDDSAKPVNKKPAPVQETQDDDGVPF